MSLRICINCGGEFAGGAVMSRFSLIVPFEQKQLLHHSSESHS